MTNGKIDDAKVHALVHGPREDLDTFLVTSVVEIRHTLDAVCASQGRWRGVCNRFIIPVAVAVVSSLVCLVAAGIL